MSDTIDPTTYSALLAGLRHPNSAVRNEVAARFIDHYKPFFEYHIQKIGRRFNVDTSCLVQDLLSAFVCEVMPRFRYKRQPRGFRKFAYTVIRRCLIAELSKKLREQGNRPIDDEVINELSLQMSNKMAQERNKLIRQWLEKFISKQRLEIEEIEDDVERDRRSAMLFCWIHLRIKRGTYAELSKFEKPERTIYNWCQQLDKWAVRDGAEFDFFGGDECA